MMRTPSGCRSVYSPSVSSHITQTLTLDQMRKTTPVNHSGPQFGSWASTRSPNESTGGAPNQRWVIVRAASHTSERT